MQSLHDPLDFGAWGTPAAEAAAAAGPAAAATAEPDAAVRARLAAGLIDAVAVGAVTLAAIAVRGTTLLSFDALLTAWIAQFLYFSTCDALWRRTPGKRALGLHVVALDGAPASAGQIAIRSVARLVDALPGFYAIGLLSVMGTGPSRRQRLGDVAAGTLVAQRPEGRRLQRQPSSLWIATIVAVVASVLVVVGAVRHADRPAAPPAQSPAAHP